MKYLKELQQKKLFTLSDVTKLTGKENTAKSLLQNYKAAGYIDSVRKNLYAAVDIASGNIIASRYEIASHVSKTSYVSHHSALEFHGVSNQVFFEVTVSSQEKIRGFSLNGVEYRPVDSKMNIGVITPPNNPMVRVTDIERTVVDCFDNIDLAGGLEEVLESLQLIPQLQEDKLTQYLRAYDKRILWQRMGFVLDNFREMFRLSSEFFDECRSNMGVRKNYIGDSNEVVYYKDWRIYGPRDLGSITREGDDVIV